MRTRQTELYAENLLQRHAEKAEAKLAKKIVACWRRGETKNIKIWRLIRQTIKEMQNLN